MKQDEVLKLALEALEEAHHVIEHKQDATKRGQAINAIKAALAQPEQRITVSHGTGWDTKLRYKCNSCGRTDFRSHGQAQIHICEALAQPEQEPVRLQCVTCGTVYADGVPPQVTQPEQGSLSNGFWVVEVVDTVVNAWPLSQEALLKIALGTEDVSLIPHKPS